MRDVQPLGDRLQAGQFNDLCPLHRRDPEVTSRVALPLIGKQAAEPPVPIPLTGSPNGGFVALELRSEVFSTLACGDPENNSRTPDLIPRRRVTVSDPLQLGHVRRVDRQHLGLAAAHAGISHTETEHWCSITGCSNSVPPADLKKDAGGFDLPIALGLLLGSGQIELERPGNFAVVGELALTGQTRAVKGVLAMALAAAAENREGLLVPAENAEEAAVVDGLPVYAIGSLAEAVGFLSGPARHRAERCGSRTGLSGSLSLRGRLRRRQGSGLRQARDADRGSGLA